MIDHVFLGPFEDSSSSGKRECNEKILATYLLREALPLGEKKILNKPFDSLEISAITIMDNYLVLPNKPSHPHLIKISINIKEAATFICLFPLSPFHPSKSHNGFSEILHKYSQMIWSKERSLCLIKIIYF